MVIAINQPERCHEGKRPVWAWIYQLKLKSTIIKMPIDAACHGCDSTQACKPICLDNRLVQNMMSQTKRFK